MRNLKLTLAYDGTSFHGWQIQPDVPTVQGELQRSLKRILNHEVTIHGSGRTDAGVHAHGQVANFQTDHSIDTDALLPRVNSLLPIEIRVVSIEEVPLDFHARLSAKAKTYEYHCWRLAVVPPFHHRYVAAIGYFLDTDTVDQATKEFRGTHDFTSFCPASTALVDRVRTIHEVVWERSDQKWVLSIQADGFLQYMVRTIVGTLIEVGRGRIPAEQIREIIQAKDRALAGPSAPAQGLHLMQVCY